MSVPSTLTHVHAPCLQTCCIADFQSADRPLFGRLRIWKSSRQQVWKPALQNTSPNLRPGALRQILCARGDADNLNATLAGSFLSGRIGFLTYLTDRMKS